MILIGMPGFDRQLAALGRRRHHRPRVRLVFALYAAGIGKAVDCNDQRAATVDGAG